MRLKKVGSNGIQLSASGRVLTIAKAIGRSSRPHFAKPENSNGCLAFQVAAWPSMPLRMESYGIPMNL